MSEPGGLFFLRPAKTGSSSLRAKLAAAHECSSDALQVTALHARIMPFAGYSASNHSDGTQGAAEEKELTDHVTALYQADWDLWQERCEGTVSRIEHALLS